MNGPNPFDTGAETPRPGLSANACGSASPPSQFGGDSMMGRHGQYHAEPPRSLASTPGAAAIPHAELDPTIKRAIFVVGGVIAAYFAIVILRWIVRELFGGPSAILILALATACGYLYYRSQKPEQARKFEAGLRDRSQAAVDRTITAIKTSSSPRAQYRPSRTQDTATHPSNWSYGVRATATNDPGADSVKSALLLIPSLIAYGVVYGGTTGLSSPWAPWWILTGLNVYFIVCVTFRALPGRGLLAVLLGLAGTVLIGLAASPSPDWNLATLLSQKHSYGEYTYSSPPEDLLPWIARAPLLAVLFFVLSWGVARRRHATWLIGLIPAALVVAYSIWYGEHAWTGAAGWFGWWLMTVGAFVGGCLACWVFDAIANPSPHQVPLLRYGR